MSTEPVLGFSGEYRFLSNFWFAPVDLGGFVFEFNEKWYMANKTEDSTEAAAVMACTQPAECKRVGRTVTLRPDWEEVKDSVMLRGLRMKFGQNPDLAAKLAATQHRYLEETNTWGDKYWGVDLNTGKGKNMLGILLMQVRAELA